jgi:hypothetical protein
MDPIITMISLAALVLLFAFPYEHYRVERLKEDLFSIRDALFETAAAGNISFESTAYRGARTMLNGMIRCAPEIGITQCIVTFLVVPKDQFSSSLEEWNKALSAAPGADRALVRNYIIEAHTRIARHVLTSPMGCLLVAPALTLAVAWVVGYWLHKQPAAFFEWAFRRFDSVVYAVGRMVQPARHAFFARSSHTL